MNLLDEKNIIDFNARLLDESGIENFLKIFRKDIQRVTISYLEPTTKKNILDVDFPTQYIEPKQKIIQSSVYRINYNIPSDMNEYFSEEQQETLINDVLIKEATYSLSNLVVDKIKELSDITYLNSYNWFTKILNKLYKLFGKRYVKKIKVRNTLDFIKILSLKIDKLFRSTRTFGEAYIICSPKVGNFLQESTYFCFNNNLQDINGAAIPYFIGTIYSTKIFIDPNMTNKDTNVYIGFKNDVENLQSPCLSFYFQENGTQLEDIDSYVLGHEYTSEPIKKKQLSLRMALFTLGDNPSDAFDKIVLKLPKKI